MLLSAALLLLIGVGLRLLLTTGLLLCCRGSARGNNGRCPRLGEKWYVGQERQVKQTIHKKQEKHTPNKQMGSIVFSHSPRYAKTQTPREDVRLTSG